LLTVGTCTIAASQSGDSTYAAAATVTRSFTVTSGSGSGGSSADGDVPLPDWALALLAAGLLGAAWRQRRTA
jgi:uncharacterized membrane protein YfcA